MKTKMHIKKIKPAIKADNLSEDAKKNDGKIVDTAARGVAATRMGKACAPVDGT